MDDPGVREPDGVSGPEVKVAFDGMYTKYMSVIH